MVSLSFPLNPLGANWKLSQKIRGDDRLSNKPTSLTFPGHWKSAGQKNILWKYTQEVKYEAGGQMTRL